MQRGDSLGPYVLLQHVGEGGFGEVWLAERREPMVQRVAVKIIKPGMDSRAIVARFEQERQTLALMDHEHVARVLDAGVTSRQRPYVVMEYVAGLPITEHCNRARLSIRDRILLFLQLCEAVEHAHQKGVIHRDLKPSNILVAIRGEAAVVKVIDFGVARALHGHVAGHTVFTEHGHWIGTPDYMSPEQAEMGAQDIDTRADIYSLGVVLYELITGERPFNFRRNGTSDPVEILRTIRDEEPDRPSTRVSRNPSTAVKHAHECRTEARGLQRELRRDLDWIVMKALEKDRMRRYSTVTGLADDLRRYLNDEVVEAGRPGVAYRLRKFARRRRGTIIAAALIGASLLAAATVFALGERAYRRALRQAARDREAYLDVYRAFYNVVIELTATDATQRLQAIVLDATTPIELRDRFGQWRDGAVHTLLEPGDLLRVEDGGHVTLHVGKNATIIVNGPAAFGVPILMLHGSTLLTRMLVFEAAEVMYRIDDVGFQNDFRIVGLDEAGNIAQTEPLDEGGREMRRFDPRQFRRNIDP